MLIGTEGINFIKEFYSTLVEDPDTDIIVIDPDSPSSSYTALKDVLCKENGYDVKITEVKTSTTGGARFIEVLNRGATATITAGWNGGSQVSMGSVGTGSYATADPGSGGSVCFICYYHQICAYSHNRLHHGLQLQKLEELKLIA